MTQGTREFWKEIRVDHDDTPDADDLLVTERAAQPPRRAVPPGRTRRLAVHLAFPL